MEFHPAILYTVEEIFSGLGSFLTYNFIYVSNSGIFQMLIVSLLTTYVVSDLLSNYYHVS